MRMMKQLFRRGFILPAVAVCSLLVPCTAAQAALVPVLVYRNRRGGEWGVEVRFTGGVRDDRGLLVRE